MNAYCYRKFKANPIIIVIMKTPATRVPWCVVITVESITRTKSYAKNRLVLDSIVNMPRYFTTWKVLKYGVFSGPHFPYLVWIRRFTVNLLFSSSTGKYRPEKTSYLDTFHAVTFSIRCILRSDTIFDNWKPLIRNDEKCLLFNFKSSFRSQDI